MANDDLTKPIQGQSMRDRIWLFMCFMVLVVVVVGVVVVWNVRINEVLADDVPLHDWSTEDAAEIKFTNFRNVVVGRLRRGMLYRSASPIISADNRASVVDRFVEKAGVRFVVNLSENEKEFEKATSKEGFDSPYLLTLYEAGKIEFLDIEAGYDAEVFGEKLARGLVAMAENEGPYLVHCVEGKDRTGFAMMVLEALAGASYEEMVDDYMMTYDNYYGVNRESDPERYKGIKKDNIDAMLYYVVKDKGKQRNLAEVDDYSGYAKEYLRSIGIGEESIGALERRLTE